MDELQLKVDSLKEDLQDCKRLIVAYSGGVDSTFLAVTAHEILGDKALAVTVQTAFSSQSEMERAKSVAKSFGFAHRVLALPVLEVADIAANTPERCYHCKHAIFRALKNLAKDESFFEVADGGNWDDRDQYRPGRRALEELGIRSPLMDAHLTKAEIRELSFEKALPTWNIPSQSCLATRFPYGTPLTQDLLSQIDAAEADLRKLGYEQVRLRHHGDLARIELGASDFERIHGIRIEVVKRVKEYGYRFVCLDLEGYRFGSMDENKQG